MTGAGWIMARRACRHAGLGGLVGLIGLIGVVPPAEAGRGNGPPPGGEGFNGSPGGFGLPSPPRRGLGSAQDHSAGYDYSDPNFNFSVRKTRRAADRKQDEEVDDGKARPAKPADDDLWTRLRSGFGLFGE